MLLILKTEKEIDFLLRPNLKGEEQRVMYVGVSRSRERLYISIPELNAANEAALKSLFNFKRMSKT